MFGINELAHPQIFYHGTWHSFSRFRNGDIGFHFGSEAYIAFSRKQIIIIDKISGKQIEEINTYNYLGGFNMGVGVYSNDFGGFGTTFLISPFDHITEENYNKLANAGHEWLENSFEDWADLESEAVKENVNSVISQVVRNFDGDFLNPRQRTWDDDMLVVANIGDIQIYTREWQHDGVVGIAPNKYVRDILDDANAGYPEKKLECIDKFGASPDKVTDSLALQVEAVKRDLIAYFQEAGIMPSYKTSGYTTSSYSPMEPAHPESEEEAKKQKAIRLEPFAKFSDQDKLDAYEQLIEDVGLSNYIYVVNKDERGEFYADVRDMLNEETMFEVVSDKNGEIDLVRDGFMKHRNDTEGLELYLKSNDIINGTKSIHFGSDKLDEIVTETFGTYDSLDDFIREYGNLKNKLEEEIRPR